MMETVSQTEKKENLYDATVSRKECEVQIQDEIRILQEELRQRKWTNSHIQYFSEMFVLMMSVLNGTEDDVETVRMMKYFLDGNDYKDIALLTDVPVLQVMAGIRKFGRAFLRANTYKTLCAQVRIDKDQIHELKEEILMLKEKIRILQSNAGRQGENWEDIQEITRTGQTGDRTDSEAFLRSRIEDHPLSCRIRNALNEAGINRIYQLLQLSWDEVKNIRNLGLKSTSELLDFITDKGYAFRLEKGEKHVI